MARVEEAEKRRMFLAGQVLRKPDIKRKAPPLLDGTPPIG